MKLRKREKILLIGVILALIIFLFDRLFDTPMNRKISHLRGEVKAAETKLKELDLLVKGLNVAEEETLRLEKELKNLSNQTLQGEEFRAFLRHLARSSDPLQMKVISMLPTEEKIVPSDEKKGVLLRDSRKITVQLILHSTFSKLESYLKGIEELPFRVSIEGLQIERTQEAQPLLKVTLNLMMYMIVL